MSAGGVHHV
ncbi:hypothetical protein OIU84_008163, partial [Salix udensis]